MTNRHSGTCERCGQYLKPGQGNLQYCVEDSGCPKHHDEGGYHLYCVDVAQCNVRREEARKTATERKAEVERKAAELKQLESDWSTVVAGLTAGLETTGYGPRIYTETLQGAEVVAQAPEGVRSAAYHFVVDKVCRFDCDLLTVNLHDWIVRRHVTPERARELRLQWARENNVTIESAQEAKDGGYKYIGEDQKAMYEAVLRG